MKTQHTPLVLPLIAKGDQIFDPVNDMPLAKVWQVFYRRGDKPVVSAEETARLIVSAVNCHHDLLEACKRAAPWLGRMIADGNHKGCVMPNDCERTLELIEAAITKATGGQV